MDVNVGQILRTMIKFRMAEGIDSTEICHRLSAVFQSDTLSNSGVFEWCTRFVAVVNLSVMTFMLQPSEARFWSVFSGTLSSVVLVDFLPQKHIVNADYYCK